ncbi:MAG TPA: DUF983 domain-containing protein [Gillisia sp.]|nr:DUF983 domain-containing protein [Gillisia sp.]
MKFLKGTKIYSILTGTCPVCQEESMYKEPNPYKLRTIFKMHERCSHCHTKYKIEPSFFFGAMYVSYGLGVAIAVAAFIVVYLFFGGGLMATFIGIIGTLVVLMPIIVRVSRNIWINLFLNYRKPD